MFPSFPQSNNHSEGSTDVIHRSIVLNCGGKRMKTKPMRISTRLTSRQREIIEEKIAAGEYESLSDFLRGAIERTLVQ